MEKNSIRKQLTEVSKYLNMKALCREAKIDYSNYVKFKAGDNGKISDCKLKLLISIINSIEIYLDVPAPGTNKEGINYE